MNVLILTARFGLGHVKCAEALKERIEHGSEDVKVDIVDLTEYLFPSFHRCIYACFGLIAGTPKVYNYFIRAATAYGGVPLRRSVVKRLDALIEKYRPDLVLSCHSVCGCYFSEYKRQKGSKLPLYTYITDVGVHNMWISDETDMYFVGDSTTGDKLKELGVDEKKIHVSGVPVSLRCGATAEAEAEEKSGRDDKYRVLVMGGGLGLIPGGGRMLRSLNLLAKDGKTGESVEVFLLSGKNRSLARRVRRKYENIEVLGYSDRVPELMAGANLLVTKPGGSTTFEAIAAGTPLFVVCPKLEQEFGNATFIEERGIGRVLYDKRKLSAEKLEEVLKDRSGCRDMCENMAFLRSSFESANPLRYFENGGAAN